MNSAENSMFQHEDKHNKKHKLHKEGFMEDITQKTIYMSNTISPLYPRLIIEEHDFRD